MIRVQLRFRFLLVICRNVLKTTIDVPKVGEVNFYCTHLDHLNEDWRMKQINSIIQSNDAPHILVGGLNSLDETDYSQERWTDIVKVINGSFYRYVDKKRHKFFQGELVSYTLANLSVL